MTPLTAIQTCLAKSFQFSGRASRSEFWWFACFLGAIWLVQLQIDWFRHPYRLHFDDADVIEIPYSTVDFAGLALAAAVSLPMISAMFRRISDTTFSPLLVALPIILAAITGFTFWASGGPASQPVPPIPRWMQGYFGAAYLISLLGLVLSIPVLMLALAAKSRDQSEPQKG